jgi:hypothetical protein
MLQTENFFANSAETNKFSMKLEATRTRIYRENPMKYWSISLIFSKDDIGFRKRIKANEQNSPQREHMKAVLQISTLLFSGLIFL